MIRATSSSLQGFKAMTFKPGLNIILADKSPGANERQSRNGAGKTSFIELVHFLLGADAKPKGIFRSEALVTESFSLTLDVLGQAITVTRSGSKPSKIEVEGDASSWPVQPDLKEDTGEQIISNENWKTVLGEVFFGLNPVGQDRFGPKFRQLFAYFVRRQESGAFSNPLQQAAKQQLYDQQVAVSTLLGLDGRIAQEFQELRTQEKLIGELRKAAKGGALRNYVATAAELRTELAIAKAKAERLGARVDEFTVVDEYGELEREANEITQKVSALNDQNTQDRQLISRLEDSLQSETPPEVGNLEKLYRDAGVLLPDNVQKRFDEVEAFHRAIVENRKQHLAAELDSARERVDTRNAERETADDRRKQIMMMLSSGGALEHYTSLREEAARVEGEVQTLSDRLVAAERIESTKTELEAERNKLYAALQSDYQERADIVAEAVLAFEDLSNALYERAGRLTISPTRNGPEITFDIEGQRSKGIGNMQIFCFDLMLMDLVSKRNSGPGFLIHDSHLFDGVDERQVARALQLGARHAEEIGYQYIVTMNSDALPTEGFDRGFAIEDYFNPVRLTDAEETGGLFGLRFG
ncbi:MAG: ABC-three component system protein [Pseudomonadota bacterium]